VCRCQVEYVWLWLDLVGVLDVSRLCCWLTGSPICVFCRLSFCVLWSKLFSLTFSFSDSETLLDNNNQS
jgi:hypothetical protein